MIRFYDIPLITAGGLTHDYSRPKEDKDSEYHLLTRTGLSFSDTAEFIVQFFQK